ncbi:MAG TPA: 4Fe-4S dicluster domain-containing protein [Bacteroidales bacterium]|nr:4Fe-4S dicluster domain-containing protein [Bacteroidales bacterium]
MLKQLLFGLSLLITLGVFAYTMRRLFHYFRFTRPKKLGQFALRLKETFKVAILQTKIMRFPLAGWLHALVFWGFIVILFGSIEMVFDGLAGTERAFSFMGRFYDFLTGAGDVFAFIILISILVFLSRRLFFRVQRFYGTEMKPISKADANLSLSFILLLMVSLLGMNTFYLLDAEAAGRQIVGSYPVSAQLTGLFSDLSPEQFHFWHEFNWWFHILLIFLFANVLPYSKHFHVFMSVPNVFVSRVEPLGVADNMDSITREVKMMLDPTLASEAPTEVPGRFGVADAEDVNWVNYFNALSCTECGRCTSVCPANITGKLLSPRKIMMDLRARMKEKGPGLIKEGKQFDDGKALLGSYITEEELWACTMCNACAMECPINIHQPSIILDMRRYLVLEKSAAPGGLNAAFTNIENNGAPWQFSPHDRLKWAEDLYMNHID